MTQRFDTASATWDRSDTRVVLAQNIAHAIMECIALDTSMEVLDFGAGTGLLSFAIAPWVSKLVALDLSEGMLAQARAKNTPECTIETLQHDLLALPLERQFDGIISSMALHHVQDTRALLESFTHHVRAGGWIALADLDSEDGGFHTHGNEGVHHFGFDRDTLTQILSALGWEEITFRTAHTITREGGDYTIFLLGARLGEKK